VQVSRSEQQVVVERFLAALRTGQLQELLDVMAPHAVLLADGGGIAATPLRPGAHDHLPESHILIDPSLDVLVDQLLKQRKQASRSVPSVFCISDMQNIQLAH
jgi:hypothetical protein